MKKIIISNGETRIGYEFKDLSSEAKDKVLNWWFQDMCEEEDDIVKTFEANKYLFDEQGQVLPITHFYTGVDNHLTKIEWTNKYNCILEEYQPINIELTGICPGANVPEGYYSLMFNLNGMSCVSTSFHTKEHLVELMGEEINNLKTLR